METDSFSKLRITYQTSYDSPNCHWVVLVRPYHGMICCHMSNVHDKGLAYTEREKNHLPRPRHLGQGQVHSMITVLERTCP